jgi:hypothetical protein
VASNAPDTPDTGTLDGTGVIPGAISFINSTTGSSATGTPNPLPAAAANHTAGNFLAVGIVASSSSGTVSGIIDTAGNLYSQCAGARGNDSGRFTDIWYAANINGNANNVVSVTFAGSYNFRSVHVIQYSNVATVNPCETAATGNCAACSTVTSGSFSPAQNTNVNFAVTGANNTVTTWTPGTNYVQRTALGSGSDVVDHATEDRIGTPSGSQTASQTINTTANMQMSVASFRQFVAGGPPAPTARILSVGMKGGVTVKMKEDNPSIEEPSLP